MSKINDAIKEIESLNISAGRDVWLNRINPLVKLAVTVSYIFFVVSFSFSAGDVLAEFFKLVSFAVYPVSVFFVADISFAKAVHRLRFVLPVVFLTGVLNVFFDREIVFFAERQITRGIAAMIFLTLKGLLSVFAVYILVCSTTIEKICSAFYYLHFPKIIVTEILLIYRYSTLLLKEFRKMYQAYMLRSPGQKGIHISVWGSFVGNLFLRTADRAETIYESMSLRGFDGDFSSYGELAFKWKDLVFLFLCEEIFAVLKIFPVFTLLGGLFV